jgi:hypothetical protein
VLPRLEIFSNNIQFTLFRCRQTLLIVLAVLRGDAVTRYICLRRAGVARALLRVAYASRKGIEVRKFTIVLLLCLSCPVMATPIIYDLEYQIRSASPNPVNGNISSGDVFHVNFAWDWDSARGAPDADNRTISTGMGSYNTTFGNYSFHETQPGNFLYLRNSGATGTRVEDWEPSCHFVQGGMAGTECLSNGLLVDELIFGFECANWSSATHVLQSLDCDSGLTGIFAFGVRDVAGLGRTGGFLADLRSATDLPEPAPWALFAGGLVCLLLVRRRRRVSGQTDHPGTTPGMLVIHHAIAASTRAV